MSKVLTKFTVLSIGICAILFSAILAGCTSAKKSNGPTTQPANANEPADGSALNVMAEDDTRHVEKKMEERAKDPPPSRPTRIDYRRGRGVVDQPATGRP